MQPSASDCATAEASENRNLLSRLVLDLVVFVVLIIPIAIFEYAIEPFHRGFFCDDETIRYPFKGNTITTVTLGFIIGIPPVLVFLLGEYARKRNGGQLGYTKMVFGKNIPTWMTSSFQQFAYFCFGLLLTFDATEVGKYTIGRLRPHFMAVCQPQLTDGTSCSDAINQHRYIENYFCLGSGFTVQDVREARLSFPSGHSSMVFYSFIYLALYLQKRMHWQRSYLSRHFIQFSFIMLAWFTALSRVMDNWHHWSDVLLGSIIGIIVALITANYISNFFKSSFTDFGSLRLTGLARQDTSATLNEVFTQTPPPYTTDQPAFSNEQYCSKV